MNERINELRLEAGISRLHDEPKFMVAVSKEGTVIEPLDGLEKFAQLIIQECAGIASEYDAPKMSGPGMIIANRIESHFGVEE